jgi:hypothetical protein
MRLPTDLLTGVCLACLVAPLCLGAVRASAPPQEEEELQRPPRVLSLGDDEPLLLLPDVPKELDWTARDFAASGDVEGQKELRASRPWGRLYPQGWPSGIQYLKAEFGGAAPEGSQTLHVGVPADGCSEMKTVNGGLVLVNRGTCTFGQKARRAQEAGAQGVIIVNNESGITHPPGPDAIDLEIFAAMISQAEGGALLEHLQRRGASGSLPLEGFVVPILCKGGNCRPTTEEEEEIVSALTHGGTLLLDKGAGSYEYLLALFGTAPLPNQELILMEAHPSDACSSLGIEINGAAVLVKRGGCGFSDKVANLQVAGAAAMILWNNEPTPIRMGSSPAWVTAAVNFPVVSVADASGAALSNALQRGEVTVNLHPSSTVTESSWNDALAAMSADIWPQESAEQRRKLFDSLLATHADSRERQALLRAAYELHQ